MTAIKDLAFSDLYICLNADVPAHFRLSKKGAGKHPDIMVPFEYRADLAKLATYLNTVEHGESLMVHYDGLRLRAAFFETAKEQKWVALRKVATKPPPLEKLGLDAALVPHLKALGKRGGLILMCGSTGQGKTTTCCSMLVDYMENLGGVGFTIEDPVEYDMEGRHGESGFCYQVEVRHENEWAEMLAKSLRCHPRYIFIGEVCTPDAANQLLRAATSGHLVIATVHAGNLFEGLEGILQLAEQKVGDRARQLLSSSLTAILHQSLNQYGLTLNFLLLDNGTQSAAIRSMIRDNHIGQIASAVEQQRAQLQMNGQIFRNVSNSA